MKRPIESGLTAFWLNAEMKACTASNGRIVLPVARTGSTEWYGNSSCRVTQFIKLLFENSERWRRMCMTQGRRGLRANDGVVILTCRIHEGSYTEDVADGVCRRPGPGYAHMSSRHRYSRRAAHFSASGRHSVGVGIRVYVIVREPGLCGGLLTLILVGLGEISNLVA